MLRGSMRALRRSCIVKMPLDRLPGRTPELAASGRLSAPIGPDDPAPLREQHDELDPAAPDPNDNFLSGNAANYIDEMYLQWKEDPKSVHVSWQVYFKNMESGDMPISQAFTPPPSLVPSSVVPSLAAGAGVGLGEGSNVDQPPQGPAARPRVPGPRPPQGPDRSPRHP